MPGTKRICADGEVFHALNRSVARLTLFENPDDYAAFMPVVDETWQKIPLTIYAMSMMPNRRHTHYETGGSGFLYQGRFNSFPIQTDEHLLTVIGYVERNPLRANLVNRAEEWFYGSAWLRHKKQTTPEWLKTPKKPTLPRNWRSLVNKPQTDAELEAVRKSIVGSTPYGSEKSISNTAARLSLESTTRPRGRPRVIIES
ncbi:hypothetical protein [Gimesia algae]|uniref:Transposase IS200-like domain-containing protein n=1 Tax=Gimesia algae TaxID=2527971 RepID=A0A517VAA9_9PLAN|nr:hypothetical protein [Gimesia algae]QDT89951.1 hypothetical protein Pan161_15840 [Gimesia algae]